MSFESLFGTIREQREAYVDRNGYRMMLGNAAFGRMYKRLTGLDHRVRRDDRSTAKNFASISRLLLTGFRRI
ncbi:hypothetical protein PHSY_004265 [Pseudozyma hubeiensis SY62]|uniref:Uncharacterized protein n=1 Tax=Pseudozyma hubeiensis (strain SY62) TaxID=1305764 RepID=R9P603_PSEHS|nr:hypothetical protein PHSY_004265 [Pseudozyma hubeiensis SY62]GAC96682.1 hypothetical protein PHSY_004265 [Pseudozyma hubeiensis SY62]